MASEGSSTPAPAESSTRAPEGRSTPALAGSSTPAAAGSSNPAAAGSSNPAPAGSSTLAPAESSTPAPPGSSNPAPAGSSNPAPPGSSTLAPAESSTPAPAESSTPAPAGSSTPAPAESSTPAPPGSSTSVPKDSFTAVSSSPEWKKGLKRFGSCLKLYDLLQSRPELIHELGPNGITVLHKGVDHGCVKLVRFVLVDMFNEAGMCKCKGEENGLCALTREGLLRKTNKYGSTAVNMAIVSGSPKMVLLLEWAIRVSDKDKKMVNRVNESYTVDNGELLRVAGLKNWKRSEIELAQDVVGEVPDVKDDEISESIYLYEGSGQKTYIDRDMQLELYKIIAAKLNERSSTDEDQVVLKSLKDSCAKNVDFEFVPVEHIFLHFLISYGIDIDREGHPLQVEVMIIKFLTRFMDDIVAECKMWDEKNETTETMQMTLFSILDPRGRTIMHTLFHTSHTASCVSTANLISIVAVFRGVASESESAKDGAGRTLYHMVSIYGTGMFGKFSVEYMKPDEYPYLNIEVTPLCYFEFRALQWWSFGICALASMNRISQIPIYLAVFFGNETEMSALLETHAHAKERFKANVDGTFTPFQLASGLGRTKLVEKFLKHQMQFKSIKDAGFDGYTGFDVYPALHEAARNGQAEVIQMILKYPIYDSICLDQFGWTALHAVVAMQRCFDFNEIWALQYMLPNSRGFTRRPFLRRDSIKSFPRDFTKDEKICINLLLQAGIDVWTPNSLGEFPNVNSNANNEARSWWYDKVVKEVEIKKASITSVANATSVIGALVATTSFIGPLQPPLSYSPDGYVDASPISIRIYLVCNSFSFFFSIASILMAVLPSIPMPKESLYDEMIRSERCLKAAVTLLLVSIISILVSFSSASIAVVSSQWHDRKLIVASMIIGGGVCVVVLVIFIIRWIRMVFHKSSWLRRKFAKHMHF